MNLDSRYPARDVGEKARQQRHARAGERVDRPVCEDRVKAGIRKQDVEPAARRGVAGERSVEVLKERLDGLGMAIFR